MTQINLSAETRIQQGDIYKDVEYIEYVEENSGIIEISKIAFPLIIILTQDCDLEQFEKSKQESKSTQDKWLLSVLVAPLYNAEHVFHGEHLSELGLIMSPINKGKTPGDFLMKNKLPRYHYLEFSRESNILPSIIDFKHYFAVNTEYLRVVKNINYVCSVSPLYREDISLRFSNYLSRIGLPK